MTNPTPPRRIQRSRAKGWRMPPGAVYVGRPSRWGNPWTVARARGLAGFTGTDDYLAAMVTGMFRNGMLSRAPVLGDMPDRVGELRGKDLACWCPLTRCCHADVLLALANAPLICEPADGSLFARRSFCKRLPPRLIGSQ